MMMLISLLMNEKPPRKIKRVIEEYFYSGEWKNEIKMTIVNKKGLA